MSACEKTVRRHNLQQWAVGFLLSAVVGVPVVGFAGSGVLVAVWLEVPADAVRQSVVITGIIGLLVLASAVASALTLRRLAALDRMSARRALERALVDSEPER